MSSKEPKFGILFDAGSSFFGVRLCELGVSRCFFKVSVGVQELGIASEHVRHSPLGRNGSVEALERRKAESEFTVLFSKTLGALRITTCRSFFLGFHFKGFIIQLFVGFYHEFRGS